MLKLALQARNLEDQQTATIFTGKANHIQLDVKNRGSNPVGLWPDSTIVMGVGSDVKLEGVESAMVVVITADVVQPPVEFTTQFVNDTWVLTPRDKLTLAAGQSLTIDITGLKLVKDYDHATVMLTVSWNNARDVVSPERADIAPYDGRAVALVTKPDSEPSTSTGTGRPALDVGWLAEVGGPMALRAASGIIAVSAAAPIPDPSLNPTQASADLAEAARQRAQDAQAILQGDPSSPEMQRAQANAAAAAAAAAAAGSITQARSDADTSGSETGGNPPTLAPEIINRLAFRIQNNSFSPLVTPETVGGPVPYFLISWLAVTSETDPWRYDALCTAAQADRITFSILGDDQADWAIEKDEGRMQWRLRPLSPQVLFARESVVIVMDNLVTTLPPYPTALYLVYRNLPDAGNGVIPLEIEKVEAWPTIGRFESNAGSSLIHPGQEITLSWNCWGAPIGYDGPVSIHEEAAGQPSRLIKDNLPAVGTLNVTPPPTTTYYRLSMSVPAAPADAHLRVSMGKVVASLQATSAQLSDGDTTALLFKTAYASRCTITPGDHVFEGSDAISGSIMVGSGTYQLQAEGFAGPATVNLTIEGQPIRVFHRDLTDAPLPPPADPMDQALNSIRDIFHTS